MKTKCPDCQQEIELGPEPVVGDVIECEHCAAELEIVSLDPLKTAIIEEEK